MTHTTEELERLLAEAMEAAQPVDLLASQSVAAQVYTAEDALTDLQAIRRRTPVLRAAVNALPELVERVRRYESALDRIVCEGVPVEVDDTPEPLGYALAQVMVLRMIARAALNQETGS